MTWTGLQLGPFELAGDELGRGAMGTVLAARHARSGLPVAIKVLTDGKAREPSFVAAFGAEVRAMAGLAHPAVLAVLDYGQLGPQHEADTGGELLAGSPYLVMELASAGTLKDQLRERTGGLPWAEVLPLLRSMLGGLAHAHARGVVHRDLKPANVLLAGPADPRPGLKISDFGLVHAVEDAERTGNTIHAAGTPPFMAPEQFEGHFRDFGPWTDLYALGVIAFELLCGRRPFVGAGMFQIGWAHLSGARARFEPTGPVPGGTEAWIDGLLATRHDQRFQRAADARWALEEVATHPLRAAPAPAQSPPTAAALPSAPSRSLANVATLPTVPVRRPVPSVGPLQGITPAVRPLPVPSLPSFEELAPPSFPTRDLRGVGLGLVGLRRVPLVGRDEQRRELWSLLRTTRRTGRTHGILLRGAPGVGKTRLAEWLAERAHETGAATILSARHDESAGPAAGLPRLVARALRVVGLRDDPLQRRIQAELAQRGLDDPLLVRAFAALVGQGTAGDTSTSRHVFSRPQEVFEALRRLVRAEASRRVVILVLDELNLGLPSLEFARFLLDEDAEPIGPVLIVGTLRDGELPSPVAERALSELRRCRRVQVRSVPALPESAVRELLRSLLGLGEPLTDAILERAGGRPLFALELLSDWVDRGLLIPSEAGFVVAEGQRLPVPDNIHDLWQQRVQAVDGVHPGAALALEAAAVLGREVDLREWEALCAQLGGAFADPLVRGLEEARLGEERDGAWRFVHPMLQESLERGAAERGTRETGHLGAAAVLAALDDGATRGLAARRARHLVEAGRPERALVPLEQAAREAMAAADFAGAEQALERWGRTLDGIGAAPESRPRTGHDVVRCWFLVSTERAAEAGALAHVTAARAAGAGWAVEEAEALRHGGTAAARLGQLLEFERLVRLASQRAADAGSAAEEIRALRALTLALLTRGALEEASEVVERALVAVDRVDDQRGRADCLLARAQLARAQGRGGHADAREALEIYEYLGLRYAAASARNTLADLLRAAGRGAEAQPLYERAAEELALLGSSDDLAPRLNLATLAIERGDESGARDALESVATDAARAHRPEWEVFALAFLLPLDADRDTGDGRLTRAEELLARLGLVDPELAAALERSADRFEREGHAELASRARAAAAKASPSSA